MVAEAEVMRGIDFDPVAFPRVMIRSVVGVCVFFVMTMTTSSSGDWAHFVEYCFRADGTLAQARSTLNTFYGGVKRIRLHRFARDGRGLWTSTRVFDLRTGRPRKDKDEAQERN
jgi:hypothetical protein